MRPALRTYENHSVDSTRWDRFDFRPGDIVVTTPAKCGTTWMQAILTTLVHGHEVLGRPISTVSPWLDARFLDEAATFADLASRTHQRVLKTHTPIDGVPLHDDVAYIGLIRHPLDVALSDRDHRSNERPHHVLDPQAADHLTRTGAPRPARPDDPAELLRSFIGGDTEPDGTGPYSLAEFAYYVRALWSVRWKPNVHLFHYQDLWDDLDGEMRRIAAAVAVDTSSFIASGRWPDMVAALTLGAMRDRAHDTAPHADRGVWLSPADFFRAGGRRNWAELLTASEIGRFEARVVDLCRDAAEWALGGRQSAGAWP